MKQYPDSPPKPITNIAFYYILANPFYQRQFCYFTVALPNREDFIIDDDSDEGNDCEQSDIVNIMLNLAYLKQEYAENISFKKGFSTLAGRQSKVLKSFSASYADLASYESSKSSSNSDDDSKSGKGKKADSDDSDAASVGKK